MVVNDYPGENTGKKGTKGHINIRNHLGIPIFDGKRIIMVAGVVTRKVTMTAQISGR
ncbi:MAG: GAF domain-containing protein [Methanolobus sp.]